MKVYKEWLPGNSGRPFCYTGRGSPIQRLKKVIPNEKTAKILRNS